LVKNFVNEWAESGDRATQHVVKVLNHIREGKVNEAKAIWIRDLLNFPHHKIRKSIDLEGI
jgi:hypothetical protein